MVSNDYIRGVFDGEGYIGLVDEGTHFKPRLAITNSSLAILIPIREALTSQGYHPLLYQRKPRHIFDLVLRRWDEIVRFYNEIGTLHPKKKAIFEKLIWEDVLRPHCFGARGKRATVKTLEQLMERK